MIIGDFNFFIFFGEVSFLVGEGIFVFGVNGLLFIELVFDFGGLGRLCMREKLFFFVFSWGWY